MNKLILGVVPLTDTEHEGIERNTEHVEIPQNDTLVDDDVFCNAVDECLTRKEHVHRGVLQFSMPVVQRGRRCDGSIQKCVTIQTNVVKDVCWSQENYTRYNERMKPRPRFNGATSVHCK